MSADNRMSLGRARQIRADYYNGGAPPVVLDSIDGQIKAHEGKLTAAATQVAEGVWANAQSIGSSARDEFVSIATEAAEVADLVRAGRISAAEGRRRLQTLDGQRRLQSQRRESFNAMAARVEELDADPLAAGEAMAETNQGLWLELEV